MLSTLRRRMTYANVMSSIAVLLALATGTAYAANEWTGKNIVDQSLTAADLAPRSVSAAGGELANNTVTSAKVVNKQVTTFDLAPGAVTTGRILNGHVNAADLNSNSVNSDKVVDNDLKAVDLAPSSVATSELAANSVTGEKVVDDEITGADVNESTLAQVPSALLGGVGRSAVNDAVCNPTKGAGPNVCVSVELNLATQARVLLIGRVTSLGATGEGSCGLGVSRTGTLPDSRVYIVGDNDHIPLVAVTAPLDPGPVSFGVDCSEADGDASFRAAHITAVAISPN